MCVCVHVCVSYQLPDGVLHDFEPVADDTFRVVLHEVLAALTRLQLHTQPLHWLPWRQSSGTGRRTACLPPEHSSWRTCLWRPSPPMLLSAPPCTLERSGTIYSEGQKVIITIITVQLKTEGQ